MMGVDSPQSEASVAYYDRLQQLAEDELANLANHEGLILFGSKPPLVEPRIELDFLLGYDERLDAFRKFLRSLVSLTPEDRSLIFVPGAFGDPCQITSGTNSSLVLHLFPFPLRVDEPTPFGFTGQILNNIRRSYEVVQGHDFLAPLPPWQYDGEQLAHDYGVYLAIAEVKVLEAALRYAKMGNVLVFLESLIQFGKKSARKAIELLCTADELQACLHIELAKNSSMRRNFIEQRWPGHSMLVETPFELKRNIAVLLGEVGQCNPLYDRTLALIRSSRQLAARGR